ncbi:DUF1000-domain-containing protein, partial [Rhizoclosmatium globosum]
MSGPVGFVFNQGRDCHGAEFTLYKHIDIDNIRTFNEAVPGSGKTVFKSYEERLDDSKFVESDADDQLIIFIPFTGNVKLKSIAIRGFGEHSPSSMKAYINREDVDFSTVESITTADQEWELIDPTHPRIPNASHEIRKRSKFDTLLPWKRVNDDVTRITYIGLKGEWTPVNKDPIIAIYEAAANPADHKKIQG